MTTLVIMTKDGDLQIWRDGGLAWEVPMSTPALGRLVHDCEDVIHRRSVDVALRDPLPDLWDA